MHVGYAYPESMPRSKGTRQSRRPPTKRANPTNPGRRAAGDGSGRTGTMHIGTPAKGRELRARGRRTMRKLLDAGVEAFAQRGFHAARVDDIVKVARTSHGTFYLYFANKEELFRALAQEVADQMLGLADSLPPIAPGPEGRAELRNWLGRFVEVYEHYGPVIRAWTEAEIGGSEFGRLGTDVLTEFSRVLTGRIRRSSSPDVNPQIAALAVVAMIERFNYYVLSRQVHVSRDDMLDTLARVTHAGLFGGTRY
jgi:AcrR family transcriptional regulator